MLSVYQALSAAMRRRAVAEQDLELARRIDALLHSAAAAHAGAMV
ncbi:hypothetical protein [Blastococcus saxobsidens]|nr:hypothetical protein [Blastococcus saxobsidens]